MGEGLMDTGWFGVWRCRCSDLRDHGADVPQRCPGHDAEAIRLEWLTYPELITAARPGFRMERGHQCDEDNPCAQSRVAGG
jgi:hypothetical protein